jgi:hypothetical protein
MLRVRQSLWSLAELAINASSVMLFEFRLMEAERLKLHNLAYFLTVIIFIYSLGPLQATFHP